MQLPWKWDYERLPSKNLTKKVKPKTAYNTGKAVRSVKRSTLDKADELIGQFFIDAALDSLNCTFYRHFLFLCVLSIVCMDPGASP